MKRVEGSWRERIRAMLADLKMPGAMEAVDGILAKADGGTVDPVSNFVFVSHMMTLEEEETYGKATTRRDYPAAAG